MLANDQGTLFSTDPSVECLVKTESFEGPLALLLHLIKKNEVDIYNIPIAEITRQYLEYLEVMRELNLDVAGEFLVMSSTLIQIKSQMLLPQEIFSESEDDSGQDPRAELVRRLLEYERYREASDVLAAREILDRDVFARSFASPELDVFPFEESLPSMDLFDLVDAFRRVLAKVPKETFHEVGSENISIADRITEILDYLQGKELVSFEELFEGSRTRELVVASFLAILELCRLKMIRLAQTEIYGRIFITSAIIGASGGD